MKTKHNKGCIAILTNSKLKENWTRIVVCKTDADVRNACRSSELPSQIIKDVPATAALLALA